MSVDSGKTVLSRLCIQHDENVVLQAMNARKERDVACIMSVLVELSKSDVKLGEEGCK